MRRGGTFATSRLTGVVVLAVACLGHSGSASGGSIWMTTVTLTNKTGGNVWDLEANFSGVATSMYGEKLVKPAGKIKADANTASLRIDFTPAIKDGTAVEFTFLNTASPDVAFELGNWTDQNGKPIMAIDTTRDGLKLTTAAVPEPGGMTMALIGLMFLTGPGRALRRRLVAWSGTGSSRTREKS
jgi:hypothetical protein